jgi:serine/threonine-protein kinase
VSEIRPGLVLADSRYESETQAYLQRRLILFYGVTLGLALALYVVDTFLIASVDGWGSWMLLDAARLVHLAAILLSGVVLGLLRRRAVPARWLLFLDGFGLYIAVAATLLVTILDYEHGLISIPAILSLFVIARAVVVPCASRTTLILSLPAPLLFLLIQVAHGEIWLAPGIRSPSFPLHLIWDQVVLLLAVAIAAFASQVNFGLRLQVREAMQLGQYRLEELVGKGAMGEVYRASHAMLRRPTAIKVIRPELSDPELLRRFEREVRETSRLSHPNTIAVFDYGRTPDGAFYYAMEYLDGDDLRRFVERHGPLPPARVIHLLRQACGALAEAHGAGLVHRDLKPSNLMLCRRGGLHDFVKVVDFGLVKDVTAAADLTGTGVFAGTPETMAPEVLRGEPVTASADLYALGVVGYFLLTGKGIFDANSALEIVGHHLHTPPVPPRDRVPAVPADLEAVILRCLAKEPAERFADADALARALAACGDAGGWTEEHAAAWWSAHANGSTGTASPQ